MNFKKCPICKKKKLKILFNKYQQCKSCDTAWIINNPKTEYSKNYYEAKFSIVGFLFKPIQFCLYQIRNIYGGLYDKKTWIDVGAGEGGYLKFVSAKRKIGVEVSKAGRKMMKKVGIETLSEQDFLKIRNTKADTISFWHVLEHIEKPWKYIKVASKNLAKNGRVIVGIPNVESIDFLVFKNFWFHLAPDHHLWHFSKKGLDIIFQSNSLKTKYIDYFSIEHNLTGVLQSFINVTSNSYNLLHALVKRNTYSVKVNFKHLFWVIFWLTLGLPIVVTFWLVGVLSKRSGTMVFVLEKER